MIATILVLARVKDKFSRVSMKNWTDGDSREIYAGDWLMNCANGCDNWRLLPFDQDSICEFQAQKQSQDEDNDPEHSLAPMTPTLSDVFWTMESCRIIVLLDAASANSFAATFAA